MSLDTILKTPGTHVWLFRRESSMLTITEAHRRLGHYLHKKKAKRIRVSASATGMLLTSLTTYESEPALLITVTLP